MLKLCDTADITLNDLEAGRDQLHKVKKNFNEAHQAFDEQDALRSVTGLHL